MDEPKTRVGETFPNFDLGPLEAGPYLKPVQTPCELIAQWRQYADELRAAPRSCCSLAAISWLSYCANGLEALYKKP